MTQIANVRSFNGTSDEIEIASTEFQTATGPFSIAAIVKNDGASVYAWVWSLEGNFAGGGEYVLGKGPGDRLALYIWPSGGTATTGASYWTAAMGWCLVAVTKATGSATPRFHRYRYDLTSWDHQDASQGTTTLPNPGTPDANAKVWIGTYDGASEWFDGDIACVGVWRTTALSDANLETMEADIASWEALSPDALWLLDQTTTASPVTDRIGNADEIAINGTSVAAEASLAFDVGGGRTYKRLYGPAQLTGSAADLYTCPASAVARVLGIHASNPSGSPVDINLSIGSDAAGTRVYDDFEIPADSVETNFDPYELAAGEKIQGWASTAGTIVVTVSGYEDPV